MTDLTIDGYPIVLPAGTSLTMIEENPVFTKAGEYSYDLSLSLRNKLNARAYQYINRQNIENGIQYNRQAVLRVDNREYLRGTEVILEITDSTVKVQLLSGNSELNFLIGGDKNIRDLDLGIAEIPVFPDNNQWWKYCYERLSFTYPAVDWHFLPYHTNEYNLHEQGDVWLTMGNSYYLTGGQFETAGPIVTWPVYNPFASGRVPQPYLCTIIRKVIEALGYTLSYNALAEHSIFRHNYIVHGIQTLEFAKMLPGWTVNEFLSKIELQFGCVFIVNDKNVELRFKHDADNYDKRISVDSLKEYQITVEEESKEDESALTSGNFGYSLDSDDYYQFMCLSDYARRSIPVTHDLGEDSSLPAKNPGTLNYEDRLKNRYYGRDVVSGFMIYNTGAKEILRKIDAFRPIQNTESGELDVEFDIIPAAMVYTYAQPNNEFGTRFWIQIPVAGNYDPLYKSSDPNTADNYTLQELIENNVSEESETSYTKMRLAMYDGIKEMDVINRLASTDKDYFPISYVESLCEYFEEYTSKRFFKEYNVNPFRLDYLQREIYSKQRKVDTMHPYKYKIENRPDIDIRATFIINNKEFVCYKIERELTVDGFDKFVYGYFYAKTKEG